MKMGWALSQGATTLMLLIFLCPCRGCCGFTWSPQPSRDGSGDAPPAIYSRASRRLEKRRSLVPVEGAMRRLTIAGLVFWRLCWAET
ncbi:hypothetical protein B0T11DRAFT_291205 [Plectosphaerella cucumerina]|uniref:Secreted protein n=1 Tax=Plectosphaerella cucumerina TaxID=40658 RepID=A0A8K0T496_9PEZI|nr:hypothetical protein B0T11DRAFT_291205 [Plectosphaerella cucumerina]